MKGRCLSGSTRHGLPPKPKILATPLEMTEADLLESCVYKLGGVEKLLFVVHQTHFTQSLSLLRAELIAVRVAEQHCQVRRHVISVHLLAS